METITTLTITIILSHIIVFFTGYYLALKNTKPVQNFTTHGEEDAQ